MPSDVKREENPAGAGRPGAPPAIEPPSFKLLGQLFIIPLLIVAGAVGIMFLIGVFAGSEQTPSLEQAMNRLHNPGGGRTADMLVGPGSKQRYIDAKAVADHLMRLGATPAERAKVSDQLIDVLDHNTSDGEGDVRHFLLLALGRTWQLDSPHGHEDSPEAAEARQRAMATLIKYATTGQISNQKAAILALAYWAGRPEVKQTFPTLIAKLKDESQDLDVRLAAATVLGPIATSADSDVIEALHAAMRDTNPADVELVWGAALSLAQLGQKDVADTILLLLDRKELTQLKVLDRETDPKNPTYRTLSEQEQQRILINTMIGAAKLDVPAVQEKLKWLEKNDPSPRVKAAAREVLQPVSEPGVPASKPVG
jgi:hypothetical protein